MRGALTVLNFVVFTSKRCDPLDVRSGITGTGLLAPESDQRHRKNHEQLTFMNVVEALPDMARSTLHG